MELAYEPVAPSRLPGWMASTAAPAPTTEDQLEDDRPHLDLSVLETPRHLATKVKPRTIRPFTWHLLKPPFSTQIRPSWRSFPLDASLLEASRRKEERAHRRRHLGAKGLHHLSTTARHPR